MKKKKKEWFNRSDGDYDNEVGTEFCNTCGTNPWTCLKTYVVNSGSLLCFSNTCIRSFIMDWFRVSSGSPSSLWDSFSVRLLYSHSNVGAACQISWGRVLLSKTEGGAPTAAGHCSLGSPRPHVQRTETASSLFPAFPFGVKRGEVSVHELLKLLANRSRIWQKDWGCKANQKARTSSPRWGIWSAAAFWLYQGSSPAGLSETEGEKQLLLKASRGRSCPAKPEFLNAAP